MPKHKSSSARKRNSKRQSSWTIERIRPYLRHALIVLTILGVLAFFVHDSKTRHAQSACVLLVDRTGSSDEETTVASYRQLGRKAISGCKALKASMEMFYFDQQQAKIVAADSGPVDLARANVTEVEKTLEKILKSPPGSGRSSDVLEPVNQAAAILRQMSRPFNGPAHLVILSDGFHLGSEISVEQITHDPLSISPLVARATALNQIPDLANVKVDFLGTRTGRSQNGQPTADWFEPNVELFWRAIIKAGNGTVCSYGTEAALLPGRC